MAGEGRLTLYELFATLGLDASQLDAGLAQSEVNIKEFQSIVNNMAVQIGAAFTQSDAAIKGVSVALQQLESQSFSTAGAIEYLKLGNEEMAASEVAAAEAASRSRMIRMEADRAATQQSILDAEMVTAARREEAAALAEEERRIQFETAQDIEILKAKEAAEKQEFSTFMTMLEERRVASRAAMAEERYLANLQFETQRVQAAASGGNIGFRGTAVELQAMDQLLGIHIPRGLTSVVARLSTVQAAMSAAFGVFAIIGFIEIIDQAVTKMGELIDNMTGFDKASVKAWENARKGAIEAGHELMTYQDRVRGIANDNIMDYGGDIAARKKKIQTLIEEKTALEQAIKAREKLDEAVKLSAAGVEITDDPSTFAHASKDVKKDKELLQEKIDDIKKYQQQVGDLRLKEQEKADKDDKKRHDRVHELPNVLPWFMGDRSSDRFMAAMGATSPLGGTLPQTQRGVSSIPSRSFMRPVPQMNDSNMRMSPMAAPSIASKSNDGAPNVTIQNHYSPVFKFDGVPADIQQFMRDHAEPMLLDDMRKNSRGMTETIVTYLKQHGVRVNG